MVGGGRRERAAEEVKLDIDNVLMALESLKKKKGDKDRAVGPSSRKKHVEAAQQQEPPQKEVFWAPTSLTTKSCANVEYDDDDSMCPAAEPAKEEEDIEGAVCSAPRRRAVRNTTPSPSRDMVDAWASTGAEDLTTVDVVVTQLMPEEEAL
jgi:hypothetical protein|uniref:Uncharacterized protein n=1 Tax=Zea mays TaxID=4577 RepID=A0A804LGA6_MAIZE